MADPKFRTEIVADPAPYRAGMEEAARIAQSTAQQMAASMGGAMQGMQTSMQGAFGKMEAVFSGIQKAAIGAGAVIAGGGAFAAALNVSKDLTVESQKLGRAFGISATEASVLAVALGDIFQTSDVLLTANRAMTRELRTNEESFRKLGVATRDTSTGGFRNSLDIMLDVNKALLKFKEGTDRNIEGQKIYKKAWEEVQPVMKLTAEVMERSKARAEALNLVVGAENVAAVTKYRASMNDTANVMKAVSKVVGDAVMPVFTDLGNWFSETGPQRVEMMRQVMAVLVSAFYGVKFAVEAAYYGLKTVFESLWEVIKLFVEIAVVAILKFAETADRAFHFDFKGAKEAWRRGGEQQADAWGAATANIAKIAERNRDAMIKSADDARAGMVRALEGGFGPVKRTSLKREDDGRGSEGGEDKNALAKWEAELKAARDAYDRMKLEQGSFEQYTLEAESAFWKKKMDLAAGKEKLLAAVTVKYYDVERQIRKNAFEAQIAELKGQMTAAETNAEQRIALASRVAELEAQRYGRTSKQYKEALAEMQKALDEWAKKQREIRDLQADAEKSYQISRVELERQNLETLEQLGQIKAAEKLKRLKDLKQIEYTIELDALQKRLELMAEDPTTDPVKYQEQLNKIRALKEKHVAEMNRLDGQMAVESKKSMDRWIDPVADGFQKLMDGMIAGTRKWQDVVRSTLISVAQQYLATFAKIGVDWAKTKIFENFFPDLAKGAKDAAGTTAAAAAATSMNAAAVALSGAGGVVDGAALAVDLSADALDLAAVSLETAAAAISVAAAELAAAGAVSGMGGELGMVGSFAPMLFAAPGGFDVPAGIKPLTQLHEQEMVLPSPLANVIRGLAADGGSAGGAAAVFAPRSIPMPGGFFMIHKNEIVKALMAAARNFSGPKK